jgi:hypothetical protein
MTLRRALAKLTLILSIVNLSWPFSSVLDAIRGIYLETADTEWKGADDSEADTAEDIDIIDIDR